MPRFTVTPYEAALFARLSYPRNNDSQTKASESIPDSNDPIDSSVIIPATWSIISDHQRTQGLHVTIAASNVKKSLMISVRGTNNLANLRADLQGIMMPDTKLPIIGQGRNLINRLVDDVVEIVNKVVTGCNPFSTYKVIFNGHSLGGFIANLAMLRVLKLYPALSGQVESITLDAPGIGNFYEDSSDSEPRYSQQTELINNYVSVLIDSAGGPAKPNWVNSCQPQVGNLYLLEMPDLSTYQKLVPDDAADKENKKAKSTAKRGARYGSGMVSAAITGSGGGSVAASMAFGKGVLGIMAVAASIFLYSAYRAGKELLWLHSIDNIVLCMNPKTGFPYKSRKTRASEYPSLKGTVFQEQVKGSLELYSIPYSDQFSGEIMAVTGAGYDEVYKSSGNGSYTYILAAACGVLVAIEWSLEASSNAIFLAFMLSLITLLQKNSSSSQDGLVNKINHSGMLSLCNCTLSVDDKNKKIPGLTQVQKWARRDLYYMNSLPASALHALNSKILFAATMLIATVAHIQALLGSEWMAAPIMAESIKGYCLLSMILLLPKIMAASYNMVINKKISEVYKYDEDNVLRNKIKLYDHSLQSGISQFNI